MSRQDTWSSEPQYNPEDEYQRAVYAYYDTRIGGGTRDPRYAPRKEDYYSYKAYEDWKLRKAYENDRR